MSWLWTLVGFIGLGIVLYVGVFHYLPWLLDRDFGHLAPVFLGAYL